MQLAPEAGYDAVMALCGLAFTLHVRDEFVPPSLAGAREARVAEAAAAVGLRARLVATESAAQVFAVCQEALDAGFAAPVFGWPEGTAGWGLVVGYDTTRGLLTGWDAWEGHESPVSARPAGEAVIRAEERHAVPERATSAWAAIEWATARLDAVRGGHRLWVGMVEQDWAELDEAAFAARLRGHETLVESLADARTAAAGFLRRCAGALEGSVASHLLEAADAYGGLVEIIEARRPHPFAEGVRDAFLSPEWRDEWAGDLARIAALDTEALQAMRRFVDGEAGQEAV